MSGNCYDVDGEQGVVVVDESRQLRELTVDDLLQDALELADDPLVKTRIRKAQQARVMAREERGRDD